MNLTAFKTPDTFYDALLGFFGGLNIPVSVQDRHPLRPGDILSNFNPDHPAHALMKDVYFLGMVDDQVFAGSSGKDISEIRNLSNDYEGILIFGITLSERENHRLPTRNQLADITRSLNREFKYLPVTVVFRYSQHIALATARRVPYKQEWREGEKCGKVSLLRDISVDNPHTGHLKILDQLAISRTGKKAVTTFEALYSHWQQVFSVSVLSKQFYKELSDWYFWAMRKVFFPDAPFQAGFGADALKDHEVREHNARNLIRLLTRILFVWFVKEKGLIPEELFDEKYVAENLIDNFDPQKMEDFDHISQGSMYYRAILQNLFFATLNQDVGKRDFRKDGTHMNVTNLMRYKAYFKDPDKFIGMVEKHVPFMNGGLFECLDKPHPTKKGKQGGDVIIYIDGFSDRKDNVLRVPDFIFFGSEKHVDLRDDYGQNNKQRKDVSVKGLIHILNSYKFTIDENTPIEEDVALDPELLGKVFENLLASYNPETRTTARKQTGSYYTPREIVNYMVDQSLIAYLKDRVNGWNCRGEALDAKLRQLMSYDPANPFADQPEVQKEIIRALDTCKILDPACGSGAFPMGILQKMVHIIHKVDPGNNHWKEKQIEKARAIDDSDIREKLMEDIEEAFTNNELDYGRKLYVIENCIYGVDIQPIAAQISKLRFFISLVCDQKVEWSRPNFGIRPLPNLETKFVSANTLIGIDRREDETSLTNTPELKEWKKELKRIRHEVFSAKGQKYKKKLRQEDKDIREKIRDYLIDSGWDNNNARKLAAWDPYDQNASSDFFDPEWMFGISDGFDVVIGNPPYVQIQKFSGKQEQKDWASQQYETFTKTGDIYSLFYEKGYRILKPRGLLTFITSNKWMRANYGKLTRKFFAQKTNPLILIDFGGFKVFESATVDTNILILRKEPNKNNTRACTIKNDFKQDHNVSLYVAKKGVIIDKLSEESWTILSKTEQIIRDKMENKGVPLKDWNISIYRGVLTGYNDAFIIDGKKKDEFIKQDPKSAEIIKPILRGRDIKRYRADFADKWLINSHNGYKDVPPVDIKNYPAVKQHLDKYWKQIEKRQDKGVTSYNLRNCAYLDEFENEKIVWGNLALKSQFSHTASGVFINAPSPLITPGNKYILAVLNSQLGDSFIRSLGVTRNGGYFEYKPMFVERLPVPKISDDSQRPFEIHVDQILEITGTEDYSQNQQKQAEVKTLETKIDRMVYDLYGLTEDEIKIVEGN